LTVWGHLGSKQRFFYNINPDRILFWNCFYRFFNGVTGFESFQKFWALPSLLKSIWWKTFSDCSFVTNFLKMLEHPHHRHFFVKTLSSNIAHVLEATFLFLLHQLSMSRRHHNHWKALESHSLYRELLKHADKPTGW